MKPFVEGKKAISSASFRPLLSATGAQPRCAAAPDAANGGASIELVREGDKVVRMIIHCACGERMDVECVY